MYRCYNPKRFLFLLLLDALAILLWMMVSLIGKAVFVDAPPEGVYMPAIMYHSITDGGSTYQVSTAQLESDLAYLHQNGFHTVSVEDLRIYTENRGELPEKPVLLTFDDGFYNNLSSALPLLEKYDMCAVISIVGRYTAIDAPISPHADAYSYLTWGDVQALLDSGRIEIGSHTYDLHSNGERAGCSIRYGEDEELYHAMLMEDLSRLQMEMKENTGTIPSTFAYPYGFICRESVPVLRQLGFICTLTCYEQPNYITRNPDCLYGIGRYNRPAEESTETFFQRILNT